MNVLVHFLRTMVFLLAALLFYYGIAALAGYLFFHVQLGSLDIIEAGACAIIGFLTVNCFAND